MSNKTHFKLKSVISLQDFKENPDKILNTSNLALQNKDEVYQFELIQDDEVEKYEVKPGIWNLVSTNSGLITEKFELNTKELLINVLHTEKILTESKTFFRKLKELENNKSLKVKIPRKRGILLSSKAGIGKSSTIVKVSTDFLAEEPGTIILNWNTSTIRASDVLDFFSGRIKYSENATRLVLIMEDIGGAETDGHSSPKSVDGSTLNLLDGVGVNFTLPTLILATTNYPQNVQETLINRPGRIDIHIELAPPNAIERVELIKFFKGEDLTLDEIHAAEEAKDFTTAQLSEVVVRSFLHDKSFRDVVKEIKLHSKKIEKGFNKVSSAGFLSQNDD